jgi:hypothetical protein
MRRFSFPALWLAVGALVPGLLRADSPLTSTGFHEAYANLPMVAHAAAIQDVDGALLEFLTDPDVPLPHKLAAVSAVGWKFEDDRGLSQAFRDHLTRRLGTGDSGRFLLHLAECSADDLAVYGYLHALEHYLDDARLLEILPVLRAAVAKHRESFGANLVLTLVECQLLMHDGERWGRVWERYETFLADRELKRPLAPEAMEVITDYLRLYAGEPK